MVYNKEFDGSEENEIKSNPGTQEGQQEIFRVKKFK